MTTKSAPEIWGGLECSVVRIGDVWRDQLRETGHYERLDDLDRVADLGIRTLRYPVLWEQVSPSSPEICCWDWHDTRMARLSRLGLRPIVGLLHHGSGPHYTSLSDPGFAARLAAHAGRVAERYPWVEEWTPVNEPLTTARFSGLYGHWYPHASDLGAFCRMVVQQCHAVLLSMRAIRRRTPFARLVQTEDLGRVFATPRLQYQAEHENQRRWLSLDLLCGRVSRAHPLWQLLIDSGVSASVLDELRDGDGTPDIIGINHYLTSDRFLDEAVDRYPAEFAGANGRETYADVEAVRVVPPPGPLGIEARLLEAWARYGRPLAIAEVHHGCTEAIEPVRWLAEVWDAARAVQERGVDMRAVTIWSLFGAVDWRSLLRERAGAYDPGVFDVRQNPPAPTILEPAVRSLVSTQELNDVDARAPGWWRRSERAYPRVEQRAAS